MHAYSKKQCYTEPHIYIYNKDQIVTIPCFRWTKLDQIEKGVDNVFKDNYTITGWIHIKEDTQLASP